MFNSKKILVLDLVVSMLSEAEILHSHKCTILTRLGIFPLKELSLSGPLFQNMERTRFEGMQLLRDSLIQSEIKWMKKFSSKDINYID